MSKFLRTAAWTLLAAFLVYYLVTRPEDAADFLKSIVGAFSSIGRFFNTLVS